MQESHRKDPPTRSLTRRMCRHETVKNALFGSIANGFKKHKDDIFEILELPQPDAKPAKPESFCRQMWRMALLSFVAWRCRRKLKKCGYGFSLANAGKVAKFLEFDPQARISFRRRYLFWIVLNIGTFIAKEYFATRGLKLDDAKRTWNLCCRMICRGILAGGEAEKTFAILRDVANRRLKDCRWTWFNKMHGGIFTPQAQEIIIAFLQFGPECSKMLFGNLRDLLSDISPKQKEFFREIKNEFIAESGFESLENLVNHSMIRLLTRYCTKMRKDAKAKKDRALLKEWTAVRQTLLHLASIPPTPDNDGEIEKQVSLFAKYANQAGAEFFAQREIGADEEDYEVSLEMAAEQLKCSTRTIRRWEEEDPKNPCPIYGYSKKLRRKKDAFIGWSYKYLHWKKVNKKNKKD